jgi:hypothetical protein
MMIEKINLTPLLAPLLGHLYLISLAGLFGVNTALADVDTFYAA